MSMRVKIKNRSHSYDIIDIIELYQAMITNIKILNIKMCLGIMMVMCNNVRSI